MTTTRRSGRTVSRSSRRKESARSASTLRSWNSSKTTAPVSSSNGSARRRRTSTPSVTKVSRVRAETADSKRTRYPTSSPSCPPRSAATRAAAARAARRRGSSTVIPRPPETSPRSSSAGGTRVVFPAPGGAFNTRAGWAVSDATRASIRSSMGSDLGTAIFYPRSTHVGVENRERPADVPDDYVGTPGRISSPASSF